ncbi:MAG: hypothetical protein KAZ63_00195 [Vitreoscilla sp.]|jgi:hypothetical protein|nr:hypothetical protein [Vitreoscilla sp.]
MSARDVIYLITSTGATTLTRQANGWLPGTAPARARWHVVTNLIDEAFLPMDDPALRGADRRGFVELQLASRFPDSAYRAALPFRSRDRAVKSKLVLAGLGTGQAEKLIQQLVDRGEIVVGVWTLPVLLMCLLERARFKLPPTLIASLPTDQGLRVLFVHAGQPNLTRLLPAAAGTVHEKQELLATRRYLEDTRVVARGTPLPFLGIDEVPAWLNDRSVAGALAGIASPWPPAAAGRSGLHRVLDLVLSTPPGQFAPAGALVLHRAHRLRAGLLAGTAAALGLVAVLTLDAAKGSLESWWQLRATENTQATLKRQIASHQQALSASGQDAELLLTAGHLHREELSSSEGNVQPVLGELSGLALPQGAGKLLLHHLAWRRTRSDQACQATDTGNTSATDAAGAGNPAMPPPGVAAETTTIAAAEARPVPVIEWRLTFQAPAIESPVASAAQRDALSDRLRHLTQAQLRVAPGDTDRDEPLIGTRAGAQAVAGATATVPSRFSYCLVSSMQGEARP